MTPESPKAKVHVMYSLLPEGRRDYQLVATCTTRERVLVLGRAALCATMLEDLVKLVQEFGPHVMVEVATARGGVDLSMRTVEQLFKGELTAADLLI